jgi:hypothetical protein
LTDWDQYDDTVHRWITGSDFNWNIAILKDQEEMGVVLDYVQAFYGGNFGLATDIFHQYKKERKSFYVYPMTYVYLLQTSQQMNQYKWNHLKTNLR